MRLLSPLSGPAEKNITQSLLVQRLNNKKKKTLREKQVLNTCATQFTSVGGKLVTSLTHGAEPFLRSRQLCRHSRTSQHFMEPEGSIPCSQEPSTGPYPEPYQSNPHHPILSTKIHFSIVHPPTSWSSQRFLSFWLSPPISYMHSSSPPFVLHTPPISSFLIR
jgi:hypothetical protein